MELISIASICGNASSLLKMVGNFINICKVALPLIVILLAIFDITKAVISSKPDDVKKHFKNLFKRVLILIGIYFTPLILTVIFSLIGEFNDLRHSPEIEYDVCYDCLFKANNGTCDDAIEKTDYIFR